MKKHIPIYLFIIVTLFTSRIYGQDLPKPDLQSISINPQTGNVEIKWQSPDPIYNIKTHEISRVPFPSSNYSFTQPPLASVAMPGTSYTDNPPNIAEQIQTYRIRARENNNIGPITAAHYTMRIIETNYNVCSNQIIISWSPYRVVYINAMGNPENNSEADDFTKNIQYEVWGYPSSAPFNAAQAIKLSSTRSNKDRDTLSNIDNTASNYYLFIKAFLPNGQEATSYYTAVKTESRTIASYLNIDKVESKNNTIELTFNIDPQNELDTFALFRSDILHRPLIWFTPQNPIPSQYIDKEIQLGQIYSYSLAVYQCGNIMRQSDTVNNIQLYANNSGQSVRVTWGQFTDKPSLYTVIRTLPEPATVLYSATLPNQTYTDDVQDMMENGVFDFCYNIEAKQIGDEPLPSVAISEIKCVTLEPTVFMPNAIAPLSTAINTETGMARNRFGPVTQFKAKNYKFTMEIFNRMGIKLFSSTKSFDDPLDINTQYWDGKYKNEYVKEGTYIYTLKFEFNGRTASTQKGVVTVVYQ